MLFKYEIEIEIDEKNISRKYPNYRFNYDSPRELADSIAFGLGQENNTDMESNSMEEWGYSVRIKGNNNIDFNQ